MMLKERNAKVRIIKVNNYMVYMNRDIRKVPDRLTRLEQAGTLERVRYGEHTFLIYSQMKPEGAKILLDLIKEADR